MKKRNHKNLLEKDFIRINKEISKNYDAQRALGWIELDKPVHQGYEARLVLRKDISNREDAWIFEAIIEKYGTISYAKRIKDFKENKYNIYNQPHIIGISETIFNDFIPEVKKWFYKPFIKTSSWKAEYYYSKIPTFFFEIKIEKRYITKIQLFDNILKQEEAELKAELNLKHYNRQEIGYHAPKRFRKILHSKQRALNKQIIHRYISNDIEMCFDDNYKNADWLWY